MKRALGISESEGSRTRANLGGNSSAADSGQAQDDTGLDVKERENASDTVQVLAVSPPAREPLVAFQPALRERKAQDFNQLGLTPALWGTILKLLDHADLSRVMQSCRGMYHYGDDASASGPAPGPQSVAAAWKQRKTSRKSLDAVLRKYDEDCDLLHARVDPRNHARAYGQTLLALASRLHSVELAVWHGFEEDILEALSVATRWQSAHIHIGSLADAAWIRRLENALQAQGRHCRIELHIDEPLGRPEFLPTGAGLTLDGLHLEDVDYDRMEPFRALLESKENGMHALSLAGREEPDAMLPWLLTGSPCLGKLHIDDGPRDASLLTRVLQSKGMLTEFGLGNACFTADELTVKDLLLALPNAQVLRLNSVDFGPNSSGGCVQAFEHSRLRELHIRTCLLEEPQGNEDWDSIAHAHEDFCQGLHNAPHLQVLHIDAPINMHGKGAGMHVILGAFLSNPAARVVRCAASDLDSLRRRVDRVNQLRAQHQYPRVELEAKPDIAHVPVQTRRSLDPGAGAAPAMPAPAGETDSEEDPESSSSQSE